MAGQVMKSGLFKKLGTKIAQAVANHANDETKIGGVQLPPGINGVCQLVKCEFVELPADTKIKRADGTPAAGEIQYRAQAVIVEPEYVEHNGSMVKVKGLQTWCFIPIFDTKGKTLEQNTERMLNEMRKLGGDHYTADATPDMLEDLAKGLQDAAPYFRFSTSVSKGGPKPGGGNYEDGVWENWNGIYGMEDYVPPEGNAVVDDTAAEPDPEPAKPAAKPSPAPAKQPPKAPPKAPPAAEPEPEDFGTSDDLDALVEAATSDNVSAQTRLNELAIAAGHDPDTVNGAASWQDVKEMVESPVTADADVFVPEKDTIYSYAPADPKNPKKRLKAAQCLCTAVSEAKQTVQLKNMTTKAIYKDVPWGELEAV